MSTEWALIVSAALVVQAVNLFFLGFRVHRLEQRIPKCCGRCGGRPR